MTKLLKSKKLNPIIIDLDIFALINVYEMNYDDKLTIPALIIFSDVLKTKLILTVNGNFVDIEIFDHTEEMQSIEQFISVLNVTIKKVLANNTGFGDRGSIQCYLTGSYFSKPETVDAALGKLKNCEVLFPFRKITCSAGMDDEKLREFSPQLAVSVGLALRDID
jgi:Tfp pilus assembly PilM family ATPase